MPRAKAAALRALELDDHLAEAHTSLGVVRFFDWDWAGAEREFKRALELDPNYADAHIWYANFLASMARHREAAVEIHLAEQMDPLSVNVFLNASWVFYLARQDDQAQRELRNALELDPDLPITHSSVWLGYRPKAAITPAIASLEKGGPPKDSSPLLLATLAAIDATQGKKREASSALTRLHGISKHRYVCPYEMATAHATLGEKQEALRWLEEAYRQHSICLPDVKADPRVDPLRADARFRDLLRRVNLQ